MKLAVVNYAYSDDLEDPEALLAAYHSLTGWGHALAKLGHRVSVVQRFHCDWRTTRDSVDYIFWRDGDRGAPRTRLRPGRMHAAIAALEPDIVHVNGLDVPAQTWLLRRRLPKSVAIVVQDHASGEPTAVNAAAGRRAAGSLLRLTLRRTLMRAADAFFFTAAAQAEPWRSARLVQSHQLVFEVPEASSTMAPMDVATAKGETGIEGDPAVLWVGRLNENKSPLTILDGFERSLSRLPRAVLTMIYGGDDLLPSVERRIRSSPALTERVRLLGRIPHERMAAFYSAADLFVLGSHHEGSGYALIEACACGLVPVVTDIAAFRAITGGRVGGLWPPDDPTAFSETLLKVALGERTTQRRQVLEQFDRGLSWTAVSRLASAAYAEVADRRARR